MFGFTLANFAIIIPYILAFFTMFNIDLSPNDEVEPKRIEVVAESTSDSHGAELSYNADSTTDHFGVGEKYNKKLAHEAELAAKKISQLSNSDIELPNMVRNALILGGFLMGAMLWWLGLTSLINLFRRKFRPRHMLTINHTAGIVIALLGVYTILSSFIDIMPNGV